MPAKPFLVLPLDLGTLFAASEYAGFPKENVNRHNAIGLTWKSAHISGVHTIKGDFGSAKTVDFLAIVSANALPGSLFALRMGASSANVDGASPSCNSGTQTFINPSITRVNGLYHAHWELPSPQTFQWWRVEISNHFADFQCASIVLGKKVQGARFYNFDFQYGVQDQGDLSISPYGVFDETPGVIFRTVDFTLAWVTEAEWETSFRPMIEALGKRGIAYLCFDPQPTTYRQARTYMGVMAKTPFARGVRKYGTYSMDFSLLSFI